MIIILYILYFIFQDNNFETKNNLTKQITELNKLNDKLINEEKKLKTKLKEQETEINNLKKNLKKKNE